MMKMNNQNVADDDNNNIDDIDDDESVRLVLFSFEERVPEES